MTRRLGIGSGLLIASVLLAACGGSDKGSSKNTSSASGGTATGTASGLASASTPAGNGAGNGKTVTVWTVEDQAERVAAQKAILAQFTAKTGIKTKLVAVGEDQLTTVLSSAAAANKLPDVIGALSLGGVSRLKTDDLLDTDAAAAIVKDLGEGTFSKTALSLTKTKDQQLAVPSDGFAQLLFYRKDLFQQAGLAVPDTYDSIAAAAKALHRSGTVGIVAATAPADSFTSQTFEQVALANNCQLVDGSGKIALDSPQCAKAFGWYSDLIRSSSVKGNQDADTTRASYFAGKSAMVIWSSFLLDELAGLRNDALPTCPQCKADRTYLAKNTGIVTAFKGPDGQAPAGFGELVSWAVMKHSQTAEAQKLVEYMMSDGYESWLAIAPEGKVPTRTGTPDSPGKFATAWQSMKAGVDRKAPLSQFYDTALLKQITSGVDNLTRWGFPQGQGELAGAVSGQNVIPKALSNLINSGADPAAAAKRAAKDAETVKSDLGG